MHYLLDRVHTELLLSPKFYGTSETIITGIFGGLLHSEVKCLLCGTESKKYDPFLGECCVKYFLLQSPFCEYPFYIHLEKSFKMVSDQLVLLFFLREKSILLFFDK